MILHLPADFCPWRWLATAGCVRQRTDHGTRGLATVAAPTPSPSTRYYKDDGPGDSAPANLDAIPDAVPRLEPLHRFANRPYTVFGREYVPATSLRPYRERGIASWYGRKFHGEKTSTGEIYDMYAMTAAHPTLPLPSYARVTNVATGKSVVVRVNDRGPFLHGRVIDLSFRRGGADRHRAEGQRRGRGRSDPSRRARPTLAASAPLPPVACRRPRRRRRASRAPAEATVPVPVAGAEGGFVVQLGAFANFANAQNFVAHLANQIGPIGVEANVRQVNGLFRVFAGPTRRATTRSARPTACATRSGLPSTIAVH